MDYVPETRENQPQVFFFLGKCTRFLKEYNQKKSKIKFKEQVPSIEASNSF